MIMGDTLDLTIDTPLVEGIQRGRIQGEITCNSNIGMNGIVNTIPIQSILPTQTQQATNLCPIPLRGDMSNVTLAYQGFLSREFITQQTTQIS